MASLAKNEAVDHSKRCSHIRYKLVTERCRLADETNLPYFVRFRTLSQLLPVFRLSNFLVKKRRNGAFRDEKSQLFLYPSTTLISLATTF